MEHKIGKTIGKKVRKRKPGQREIHIGTRKTALTIDSLTGGPSFPLSPLSPDVPGTPYKANVNIFHLTNHITGRKNNNYN